MDPEAHARAERQSAIHSMVWWFISLIKHQATMNSKQQCQAAATRTHGLSHREGNHRSKQAKASFHTRKARIKVKAMAMVIIKNSKQETSHSLTSLGFKKGIRHGKKWICTRKRRESMMMMIMMSHDAYTHQKSKSFSSPDSWNDYPPHPILLVLTKPNHYKTQPPPPLFPFPLAPPSFIITLSFYLLNPHLYPSNHTLLLPFYFILFL